MPRSIFINNDPELPRKLRQIKALVIRRASRFSTPKEVIVTPDGNNLRFTVVYENPEHNAEMKMWLYENEHRFIDIEGSFSAMMRPHDRSWIKILFGVKPAPWEIWGPKEYEKEEKIE